MRRTTKGILLYSLRSIREEKAVSKAELAQITGLNYTSVWRLETLKTGATEATAKDIAKALKVPVSQLRKNTQECTV